MRHTTIFWLINFIFFFSLPGQENKIAEEEILESLAENSEEEIDATNYLEELKYYYENPLDLNTATREDFEKLSFLTPFQIYNIIEYREKQGGYLSTNELNGVTGISSETFHILLPFVKIGSIKTYPKISGNIHQVFLFNTGRTLEQQKGYLYENDSLKDGFEGNPLKIRTKYKFEAKDNYRAGLTAEKDAGESFFSGSNRTFDYFSGYLQVSNKGIIKNLIVGDYIANFGQGLVLWNGFAPGRSVLTINTRKNKEGLDKYSSFNENSYFRGFAISSQLSRLVFSAFISSKKIDANIASRDRSNKVTAVTSLQSSGYHTTSNEINDEDAIGETTSGCNLTFKSSRIEIGSTLINANYSAKILKSDELYKKHAFSGSNISCGGINYLLRFRKVEVFGEAARNTMKGNAFLNSFSLEIAPELSMALMHRYFETKYNSPYANVLAQNSKASNENGLYAGIEFTPLKDLKLNSYCDFFKYPFPKFNVSSPSSGANFFSNAEFSFINNFLFSVRYSYSKKQEDGRDTISKLPVLVDVINQKLRFALSYKASVSIELKNRAEVSYYNKGTGSYNGYLLFQDLVWKPENLNIVFNARYAIFETDSYDSRIYAYESDVLYSFSIPAYNGKGMRFYAMLKYSYKKMNLWIRYGVSFYKGNKVISSGLNEISGNKKSDINLQLIFEL